MRGLANAPLSLSGLERTGVIKKDFRFHWVVLAVVGWSSYVPSKEEGSFRVDNFDKKENGILNYLENYRSKELLFLELICYVPIFSFY